MWRVTVTLDTGIRPEVLEFNTAASAKAEAQEICQRGFKVKQSRTEFLFFPPWRVVFLEVKEVL